MLFSASSPISGKANIPSSVPNQMSAQIPCSLRWRQGKLWVTSVIRNREVPLPAFASQDWFLACLIKSQATAVCIDPVLGPGVISHWSQACQIAEKPLYLRIPASPYRPARQKPWAWKFKRLCDYVTTVCLLAILSPLLLAAAGLIRAQDSGPLLSTEWRVGTRGRMFQVLKFRTTVASDQGLVTTVGIQAPEGKPTLTRVGKWLKQSHLDKLPMLLNVLRGEMSLVGPHAWAIYETLELPSELRIRMHTLPGLTGTLQRFCHFSLTNPKALVRQELQDLSQWSLWKDFKQLTIATADVGLKKFRDA